MTNHSATKAMTFVGRHGIVVLGTGNQQWKQDHPEADGARSNERHYGTPSSDGPVLNGHLTYAEIVPLKIITTLLSG